MTANIEVGKSIPNLKITLGNDRLHSDENSESEEEGEITSVVDKHEETHVDVQIHRTFLPSLEKPRIYENKGGAFITGLDMCEVLTKKLEDRAARFGLQEMEKSVITEENIDELYKSLEIDLENSKSLNGEKNTRLDAIHMRGVEEMSTNDVIHYFKEYGPSFVEWINDYSCNVVWLDKVSAARALLSLSRVLVIQKKSKTDNQTTLDKASNEKELEIKETLIDANADAEVIYMSDDCSDDEENDGKAEEPKILTPPREDGECLDSAMDIDSGAVGKVEVKNPIPDELDIKVPIPPGHWRLGIPHGKAKAILLRFATKDDKKLPGAEKRSQYYQKYGNPNYGGMRGLITNTRKRKFISVKQKIEFGQHNTKKPDESEESLDKRPKIGLFRKKPKVIRLKMYADEEEEKIKRKAAANLQKSSGAGMAQSSIYSRLGGGDFAPRIVRRTRNFQEDNFERNFRQDYERNFRDEEAYERISRQDENYEEFSEEDDDISHPMRSTISKPSEVPTKHSKYNVWTSLAKSMARESNDEDRVYASFNLRTESRDLRSQLNTSSSHREQNPSTNFSGDLRSKLQKLKSDKVQKHRSPLVREEDYESESESESD